MKQTAKWTTCGMHVGVSNPDYHADKTACSSTWLKIVDKQTPFHLKSYLDSPPAEPTPALRMGAAVDCLIFEPKDFDKQFIVAPTDLNRRTKDGQAQWKELMADERTLLTADQRDEAMETAKAVRTNPIMADVLKRGVAQPVFVWKDPVSGLLCKCKLDWYDEETGTIYDLKTAVNASASEFSKAIANYGYHIQAAFYLDGVRATGKPAKRFVFAVQEKPDNRNTFAADPKLMAFYELEEEDIEAGRDAYSSSLAAINFCLVNNEWAGYTNDIITVTRPAWAKSKDTPMTL